MATIAIVVVVVVIIVVGAYAALTLSTSPSSSSTTSTTTQSTTATTSAATTTTTTASSSTTPSSLTPVSYVTDFGVGGRQAGIFAAKNEGFYAQQGLSVTIQTGTGSLNSAQLVASGKVTFADVDAGTFALAVEGGITNITAIMVLEQANSNAMMSFSPIPTPKSLENKTFGTSPGNSGTYLAPAVMALNGANFSTLKVITVSAASLTSGFLQGQFQLSPTAVDNLLVIAQFGAGGRPIYTLNYTDWGLKTYDFIIITSNSFMQSNPAAVSAFVKGTIEGVQWAMSNPAKAVSDIAADIPSLNSTIASLQWSTAQRFFATPFAVKNYGQFNSSEFLAGELFYLNATGTKPTISLNNTFTNQFVPPNQTLPIPAVTNP